MKERMYAWRIFTIIVAIGLLLAACADGTTHNCEKDGHIWGALACKNCGHTYKLGDTGPGGGIIFFVADGVGTMIPGYEWSGSDWVPMDSVTKPLGFYLYTGINQKKKLAHYLEAAPVNITSFLAWASADHLIPNLSQNWTDDTDWAIGRGKKNTAIIITHGIANGYDTPAATACVNYTVSGFTRYKGDWFLPSKDELNQLFQNGVAIGIIPSNVWAYYWSSSQTELGVLNLDFNNGSFTGYNKDFTSFVCAVRAF